MKRLTIIFFIQVLSCQIFGQELDNYLDRMFLGITHPPNCVSYFNNSAINIEKTKDSSYFNITQNRRSAMPYLISKLLDTTDTKIFSHLLKKDLKRCDLALLLINDVELIPFSKITRIQWCICCDCINFPVDFFTYFDKNRLQFYENYKSYFYSKKQNRKLLTKSH